MTLVLQTQWTSFLSLLPCQLNQLNCAFANYLPVLLALPPRHSGMLNQQPFEAFDLRHQVHLLLPKVWRYNHRYIAFRLLHWRLLFIHGMHIYSLAWLLEVYPVSLLHMEKTGVCINWQERPSMPLFLIHSQRHAHQTFPLCPRTGFADIPCRNVLPFSERCSYSNSHCRQVACSVWCFALRAIMIT